MIIWNGIPSTEVPVVVEHPPGRRVPRRKMSVVSVPGSNREILIQQDAYESVSQEYEIHIPSNRPRLDRAIHKVMDWLQVPGYNRLEDSYDPHVFRLAYYVGEQDIENILNKGGKARIEFRCRPERWLKSGEEPISLTTGKTIYNPTDKTAKPLITVSGSGSGTLTVGAYTTSMTDCNGLILDSEEEDAYRGDDNMNSTVSGDFPLIESGPIAISWTGGVTGVTIIPRWWLI